MSRLFPLVVAVLALTTAAASCAPITMHQPAVQFELAADSVVVPLQVVDGHITVQVMLDGKGPFAFLFDTGAQGSVMDLAFAREQGLDLGQQITVSSPGGGGRPGYLVSIGRLEVGGLALRGLTSIAFDGLPFPRTATSPRGVLSPYSLAGLLITVDYPGQRLVFRRGALPAPDEREVFGWDRARGLPLIPIHIGGQSLSVHLDTGASRGLSLPTALQSRLTFDGPLRDMGFARTVDRAEAVRGGCVKGALTLGRYTLEDPEVSFSDMEPGVGNVGGAMLSGLAITIDPANARLRLAGPADGRLTVLADQKPHYGLQLTALDANPPEVVLVDAGSPAEQGGLHAGDRITRINGKPVEALSVEDRVTALKATSLKLTVRRGDSSAELVLALK